MSSRSRARRARALAASPRPVSPGTRATRSAPPARRATDLPAGTRRAEATPEREQQLFDGIRDDTIWLGLARQLSTTTMLTAWLVSLRAGPLAIGVLGAMPFLARVGKFILQPTLLTAGARAMLWPLALSERLGLLITVCVGVAPGIPLTARTFGILLGMTVACLAAALYDQVINDALVDTERRTGIRHLLGSGLGERTRWSSWAGVGASLLAGVALDAVERNALIRPATARAGAVAVGLAFALVGLYGTRRLQRALAALTPRDETIRNDELPFAVSTASCAQASPRHPMTSRSWFIEQWTAPRWDILRAPTSRERTILAFALGWGLIYGLVLRHLDVATLDVMGFTLGMLTLSLALTAGTSALAAPWWARLTRHGSSGALVSAALSGMAATTLLDTVALLANIPWLIFATRAMVGVFIVGWTVTVPIWLQYADLREGSVAGATLPADRTTAQISRGSQMTALFMALYGTGAAVGPMVGGLFLRTISSWPLAARYSTLFLVAGVLRLCFAFEAGRRFGIANDPWGLALWRRTGRRVANRARHWDWDWSRTGGRD